MKKIKHKIFEADEKIILCVREHKRKLKRSSIKVLSKAKRVYEAFIEFLSFVFLIILCILFKLLIVFPVFIIKSICRFAVNVFAKISPRLYSSFVIGLYLSRRDYKVWKKTIERCGS